MFVSQIAPTLSDVDMNGNPGRSAVGPGKNARASTSTDRFQNPYKGCETVVAECGATPKEAENDTRLCKYVFIHTTQARSICKLCQCAATLL